MNQQIHILVSGFILSRGLCVFYLSHGAPFIRAYYAYACFVFLICGIVNIHYCCRLFISINLIFYIFVDQAFYSLVSTAAILFLISC